MILAITGGVVFIALFLFIAPRVKKCGYRLESNTSHHRCTIMSGYNTTLEGKTFTKFKPCRYMDSLCCMLSKVNW